MPRILWIDDEPYYQEGHRTALEEAGYTVEIRENAREALSRLKQSPVPDLIILDLILPKDLGDPGPDNGMGTGLELLKQISYEIKQKVPIIVLTIVASQSTHNRLQEAGKGCESLEVRVKPFLPSELLEEVDRLIQKTGG